MKKFGLYLFVSIALFILVSTSTIQKSVYDIHINKNGHKKDFKINEVDNKPINSHNFLQSASEEKLKTDTEEKGIRGAGSCGTGYGNGYGNCGSGYGYGSGNCGTGYGYGAGSCGTGHGYGSGNCGTGYGYGAGSCGTGHGYGSDYCGAGYGNYGHGQGYGYNGIASGYGNNALYGNDILGNNEFYEDEVGGCGPSYGRGYAQGRGHIRGQQDLRGKYITLSDAAALLAEERERKFAAANACKNSDRCARADSGSNYLDKDCKIEKKLYDENRCDDCNVNSGKDFRNRQCASANAANCARDHQYNHQKSHERLNCKNAKNEALCMNSNNLDKCCSDGNLLEEFDKLEHFKKCANGHKEKLNGKDCTVKKRHRVDVCKDSHSLACHRNGNNTAAKSRRNADAKECTDYHDHDLRNKNGRYNKRARECELENGITKACKAASSRDNEIKRQDSSAIACEKNDKILKKICDKNINSGCIDKKACIDKAVCAEADRHSVESPIC